MQHLQRVERLQGLGILETEVNVQWTIPSMFHSLWLGDNGTGTNKPKMMIDAVHWCPRLMTSVQDWLIRNQTLWNRAQTVKQISTNFHQATEVRVTCQMIRTHLQAAHLHAWRPPVVPPLTNHHSANRCLRCTQRQNWGNHRWTRVMFSERLSRFTWHYLDKCGRVWRHRNQRQVNVNLGHHEIFGGGSFIV